MSRAAKGGGMTNAPSPVLRPALRRAILATALFLLATAAHAAEPLPLVEVPASGAASDTLVVFVSGDGGWAKLDKAVAKTLAADGMPVVGLNALQYFWKKRSPESTARDLESVIDNYLTKWHKSRVILAGYSRGADVLPFVVNRLAPATRAKLRLVALLAPATKVEFEFHMTDWLHDSSAGLPIKPEAASLAPRPLLCVSGGDDDDSLCRGLAQPGAHVIILPGSHHFDGDYGKLAQLILGELH